jgi:hypothetical protein
MAWMIVGTQQTSSGIINVMDKGYKSRQGAINETRSGEWITAEVIEETK